MARKRPRPKNDRPKESGQRLVDVVAGLMHASRSQAAEAIRRGEVKVAGQVRREPQWQVRSRDRIHLTGDRRPTKSAKLESSPRRRSAPRPSKKNENEPRPTIVYQDDTIVVVNKPAGLTTVRHADEIGEAGAKAKFLPATLLDLLPGTVKGAAHGRFRLRAVHRLDRETSGLVVVARNAEAESKLGKQFREHTIERRYVALVRGKPEDVTVESELVRDRGDGRRGSGPNGQRAVTHVRVVESFDASAVVECQLETGRTHQVRIHLGERGWPLCGERVYDRPLHGAPLPDSSGAGRPMLHAAFLAIDHPKTGRRLSWTSEPPEDFQACRAKMGSKSVEQPFPKVSETTEEE